MAIAIGQHPSWTGAGAGTDASLVRCKYKMEGIPDDLVERLLETALAYRPIVVGDDQYSDVSVFIHRHDDRPRGYSRSHWRKIKKQSGARSAPLQIAFQYSTDLNGADDA
jgi:hypothetical protein